MRTPASKLDPPRTDPVGRAAEAGGGEIIAVVKVREIALHLEQRGFDSIAFNPSSSLASERGLGRNGCARSFPVRRRD